jgi:methyl-accepting chemotaxis protein
MIKSFLSPAVALMRSLPLVRKFALVCLAFLVPLVYLLTTVAADRNVDYEFTLKETQGIDTIRSLNALVDPSARWRGNGVLITTQAPGAEERRAAAAREVEAVLSNLGAQLKANDPLGVSAEIAQLTTAWTKAKGTALADPDQALAVGSDWVKHIREAVVHLADTSNLSLDPDADSYFLMLAHTVYLPALMDNLGRMRAAGTYLARQGNTDNQAMFQQLHNGGALAEEHVESVTQSLNKAVAANPALASLKRSVVDDAAKVIARHDAEFAYGQAPSAKPDEWFATTSAQLNALGVLNESVGHALDDLLEARAAALKRALWTAVGISVFFVALGLYLLAGFYAAASSTFNALGRRIDQLGDGDFTVPSALAGRDELARAGNRMREAMGTLSAMVRQVRQSAEEISGASTQIAAGNDDLARRGSEMAAVVEQTSASTATLEEAVSVNLHNAREANELVQGASVIASKGGAVVEQAVSSMNEITASSHKIGDIIQVIDTIAFQTNILALNAAVEAARAGEQGRGFAVVAGEVRALAQRSAGAAREIKSLITTSIETVTRGNEYVGQAGSTMQDMVRAIERVTTLMSEITSQSNAQADQIRQLAAAIREVDSATQQNAALVEETAATSNHLSQRAADLAAIAQQFKTD